METILKNQKQETENNFEAVFDYLNRMEEEINNLKNELERKADERTIFTLERKVEKLERELGEMKSLVRSRRRSPARA